MAHSSRSGLFGSARDGSVASAGPSCSEGADDQARRARGYHEMGMQQDKAFRSLRLWNTRFMFKWRYALLGRLVWKLGKRRFRSKLHLPRR